MSHERVKPSIRWLAFRCPGCKTELRIKAEYAAMRGRCPECGYRVDPLRPAPVAPQHYSESDEPLGLVPIEDEWPEPAQIVDDEGPENYKLASGPVAWTRQSAAPDPVGDAYGFATGDRPAVESRPAIPVRSDPPAKPYAVAEVAETGPGPGRDLPTEEEIARLMPEPPLVPPRFPLFSGLYTFPWRPANVLIWFANALNFSILALIASAIVYLFAQGGHMLIGVPILLSGAGIIFAWAGMYLANCFLAVIEDTANGNDAVTWPKGGGLLDGLGKFFYLLWIVGCAVILTAVLWVARGEAVSSQGYGWVVSLLPFLCIFPVLILSALSADAWWMLLDPKIIGNFLLKPHALVLVIVPALPLLAYCVYLTHALSKEASLLLPFGIGFAWSTFMILYGRLLGRAGWILTGSGVREKRKTPARRRRKPAEDADVEMAENDD